ncbi:uncharacterized protein ASCRUDRAFT_96563 [Ascoidea rubescens DSM 1968]|uniref:Uncharacterized protein n=1 Tax=Ascoidea rubescens DSM 1968 TaxID=1344418 RepID=A0A1D2VPK1_9ASCO|nr:hypothetical protein ASCRUDRAFT_96563 [Ascoidea rubescens DSM 1968]ODV63514.1 hypothetical protein ASCRUDRAFT_96563 [Ascoidea rubescens DSM 1968]
MTLNPLKYPLKYPFHYSLNYKYDHKVNFIQRPITSPEYNQLNQLNEVLALNELNPNFLSPSTIYTSNHYYDNDCYNNSNYNDSDCNRIVKSKYDHSLKIDHIIDLYEMIPNSFSESCSSSSFSSSTILNDSDKENYKESNNYNNNNNNSNWNDVILMNNSDKVVLEKEKKTIGIKKNRNSLKFHSHSYSFKGNKTRVILDNKKNTDNQEIQTQTIPNNKNLNEETRKISETINDENNENDEYNDKEKNGTSSNKREKDNYFSTPKSAKESIISTFHYFKEKMSPAFNKKLTSHSNNSKHETNDDKDINPAKNHVENLSRSHSLRERLSLPRLNTPIFGGKHRHKDSTGSKDISGNTKKVPAAPSISSSFSMDSLGSFYLEYSRNSIEQSDENPDMELLRKYDVENRISRGCVKKRSPFKADSSDVEIIYQCYQSCT